MLCEEGTAVSLALGPMAVWESATAKVALVMLAAVAMAIVVAEAMVAMVMLVAVAMVRVIAVATMAMGTLASLAMVTVPKLVVAMVAVVQSTQLV